MARQLDHGAIVDAADDDAVELERAEAGAFGRRDTVEHSRDVDVTTVQPLVDLRVERVEADIEPLQPRTAQLFGLRS